MKKKIIILSLQIDQQKWEMSELDKIHESKKFDIEIHECKNFIYPNSSLNYGTRPKKVKILKFKKFEIWKKYMKTSKLFSEQNKKDIIIIDVISSYNNLGPSLNNLFLNLFLKKENFYTIKFESPGLPDNSIKSSQFSIISKLKKFILRLVFSPTYFFGILRMFIINKLLIILRLYPSHLFFSGNLNKTYLKKKFKNIMKISEYSSWEYSKYLMFKKKKKINKTKSKYAVFLADRDFIIKTENQIFDKKGDPYLTINHWQKPLNDFFSKLEKIFRLKIIIAAHPKTILMNDKKHYYPRKVFPNRTLRLISQAEFAITTHSTSLCYAIIFKKPIFFINSKEIEKQNNLNEHIKILSDYLNTKPVNINKEQKKEEIVKLNRVNKTRFKKFEYQFLSSLDNKKVNYKIILNEINKL